MCSGELFALGLEIATMTKNNCNAGNDNHPGRSGVHPVFPFRVEIEAFISAIENWKNDQAEQRVMLDSKAQKRQARRVQSNGQRYLNQNEQFRSKILKTLRREGAMSSVDLAAMLVVDKSTMRRHLNALYDQGRAISSGSPRSYVWTAT